jgi:hypothetical protein
MELLQVNNNYDLEINPNILQIKCIRVLFDLDKTKDKSKTIKALTFVVLMYSPHLDYFINYPNEEERSQEIIKDLGIKIVINKELEEVVAWYKKITESNPVNQLYISASLAADAVKDELSTVKDKLAERKKDGTPVFSLKDIVATINAIPDTMAKLAMAKRKIIEGKEEGKSKFGSRNKNVFEDMNLDIENE